MPRRLPDVASTQGVAVLTVALLVLVTLIILTDTSREKS